MWKYDLPSWRSCQAYHPNLRVSGHGNARDLQLMINLLQPKYLFPIQGEYRELDAHAKAAMAVGMLPERIFIPKKGTSMAYENGDFVPAGAVSAGDVLIDGNAIGDVGNVVLRDRKACQRMVSSSSQSR